MGGRGFMKEDSRRYVFQEHHQGVPECSTARRAGKTEAQLIDVLVVKLVEAREVATRALDVYSDPRVMGALNDPADMVDAADLVESVAEFAE